MFDCENSFKAKIVWLIILKKTDEALQALSSYYGVDVPRLKVGMPKGHHGKVGCYVSKTKTIYIRNQERLGDPFVILQNYLHKESGKAWRSLCYSPRILSSSPNN